MGLGTKMLRRCPCRAAVDATDTIAATLATVSNCSTAFGYDTKTVFLCPSEVSPGLRLLPYLFAPDSQMLDGQLHRIHTFSVLAFALASVVLALTSSSFTSSSFFLPSCPPSLPDRCLLQVFLRLTKLASDNCAHLGRDCAKLRELLHERTKSRCELRSVRLVVLPGILLGRVVASKLLALRPWDVARNARARSGSNRKSAFGGNSTWRSLARAPQSDLSTCSGT